MILISLHHERLESILVNKTEHALLQRQWCFSRRALDGSMFMPNSSTTMDLNLLHLFRQAAIDRSAYPEVLTLLERLGLAETLPVYTHHKDHDKPKENVVFVPTQSLVRLMDKYDIGITI
jgi:hypothetical protein